MEQGKYQWEKAKPGNGLGCGLLCKIYFSDRVRENYNRHHNSRNFLKIAGSFWGRGSFVQLLCTKICTNLFQIFVYKITPESNCVAKRRRLK